MFVAHFYIKTSNFNTGLVPSVKEREGGGKPISRIERNIKLLFQSFVALPRTAKCPCGCVYTASVLWGLAATRSLFGRGDISARTFAVHEKKRERRSPKRDYRSGRNAKRI